MKKIVVLLLVLAVLGQFAFANGKQETTGAAKTGKLVIWSFTNELEKPIEFFKQQNPGVEVEFVIVPTEDYLAKIKPTLKTGANAPDVFTGEAAFILDLVEGGYFDDLYKAPYNAKSLIGDIAPYVVKIGTSADGGLRALSWQSTAGGVFYRRSIAKKYFGTDDPKEVAKLFSSWDNLIATARKLNTDSKGAVKMITGSGDLFNIFFAGRKSPYVNAASEFVLDPTILTYMKLSKTFRDEDLDAKTGQWAPAWFNAMKMDGNVFTFILPTWGLHYVLKTNAPDSSGDWGVVQGPASYFWGGTWLGVYKNSKVKELAFEFVKMMTLNADFLKYWAKETGDFLGNTKIVAEIKGTFSEPYLGGQNHYEYFASQLSGIQGGLMTKYDQQINNFIANATTSYIEGTKTLDEAVAQIKADVKTAYPELIVK